MARATSLVVRGSDLELERSEESMWNEKWMFICLCGVKIKIKYCKKTKKKKRTEKTAWPTTGLALGLV